MRFDVERDLEPSQPRPHAPPVEQRGRREQLAGLVGNAAMQRAAASPGRAPAALLSGAPMSVARAGMVDMAERPTGALREYEHPPQEPEPRHDTPPAASSGPVDAPAQEPETLEPVEESEPGNYDAQEESYI